MGNQIGNINFLPFLGETTMDLPRFLGQRDWKPWEKLQAKGKGRQCGTGSYSGTTMQLCASGHVSNMPLKNPTFLRLDSTGGSEISSEISEAPNFVKKLTNKVPDTTRVDNHQFDQRHICDSDKLGLKGHTLFRGMCENKTTMPRFQQASWTGMGEAYSPGRHPAFRNWNNSRYHKHFSSVNSYMYPPSHIKYPMEPGYCNGMWYNSYGYPVQLMEPIVYMGLGANAAKPAHPGQYYCGAAYNDMSLGQHSSMEFGERMSPSYSQGNVCRDSCPTKSNMKSKSPGLEFSNADHITDSMTHLHITSVKSPGSGGSCSVTQAGSGIKPDKSYGEWDSTSDVKPHIPCSVPAFVATTCSSASSRGLNVHAKVFQCQNNVLAPNRNSSSHSREMNMVKTRTAVVHKMEPTQILLSSSVINQPSATDAPKCTSYGEKTKTFHVTVTRTPTSMAASQACQESVAPKMTPSSQKKKRRPSCKKRRRLKLQRNVESHAHSDPSERLSSEQCSSKRQKTKHHNSQKSTDTSGSPGLCKQPSLSAVAILLDLDEQSSEEGHDLGDAVKDVNNEFPVFNAKFSFFISSSDSDFSENDWEDESTEIDSSNSGLTELDQELWNSFQKDDPFNPLNLRISCQMSEEIKTSGMTKNSSAPEIGTPDQLESLNALWNIRCTVSPKLDLSPVSSPQKTETCRKKVHFADGPALVVVHPLEACDDSRKGPWEQYALDHSRFQSRIHDIDKTIGYVFQTEHRSKMYNLLHC